MREAMRGERGRGLVLALLGVFFLCPDTLFVRLLSLDPWTLLFYRGLGVATLLFLFLAVTHPGRFFKTLRAIGRTGLLAGVSMSTANIFFILALSHAKVANVLAIISTAPLFGAVLSWLFLSEKLPARTWAAAGLSVAAVAVITAADFGTSLAGQLRGDLYALAHAVITAGSFVLVRRRADRNMVPSMAVGGALTSLVAVFFVGGLAVPQADWLPLAILCAVFLPLSFGLLVVAPRYIPAPEVNMIMLLEMPLGPALVWLATGEQVPAATFVGGSMLLLVLFGHSWLSMRAKRSVVEARTR